MPSTGWKSHGHFCPKLPDTLNHFMSLTLGYEDTLVAAEGG